MGNYPGEGLEKCSGEFPWKLEHVEENVWGNARGNAWAKCPRECSEDDWGSTNVRGNAPENAWENAGGNRPQRGASKLTKWQHSDTPSDLDLGLHPGP